MSQLLHIYDQKTLELQKARLHFYDELWVERSPSAVWSYFTDFTKWQVWSPICSSCHVAGTGNLQLGSVLQISFAILGVNLTVAATVVKFEPPGLISWHGQKFGIDAIHTYRFIPLRDGTQMYNDETFSGVGFPLNRLIASWYRASKLSSQSLQGIKGELLKRQP